MNYDNQIIIIFLGTEYYTSIPCIELKLPFYLSKYKTVICFEFPRYQNLLKLIFRKMPLVEKESENLIIYHSFGILPFGRTLLPINYMNYFINYILFRYLFCIKDNFNIITFTSELSLLFSFFRNNNIYYFVTDNYISLPYWDNFFQKCQILFLEKKLLGRTRIIFTVSVNLYKKYKRLCNHVIEFLTPTEIKRYFIINNKIIQCPSDLKKIPNRIVGFIGSINNWKIDIKLFLNTIRTYQDLSFVCIGKIDNSSLDLIQKFHYNNFHYLGNKSPDELPYYLSKFFVCIIPYTTGSYGQAAYPVKIMEYLAMGKPVVTTCLPSIRFLADRKLIYWSKNDTEFIQNIKIALNEKKRVDLINARIKEAKKNDWNIRIKQFISIINND